ncbi:MAG: leucine-rich repeat protein [Lachnospiraceae bacterium]|nr:leucine-rich repeat protein [Lachnospiraceae bacterium]
MKKNQWLARVLIFVLMLSGLNVVPLSNVGTYIGSRKDDVVKAATKNEPEFTPGEMNFRKKFSYRNTFSTSIPLENVEKKLTNMTKARAIDRIQLGEHMPLSAYDLEISKESADAVTGIELFKDEDNRVVISKEPGVAVAKELCMEGEQWVDLSDISKLTEYKDSGDNRLEKTENGLKFSGTSGTRGENFVEIAKLRQNASYEVTVCDQSEDYGNAILKLRKDDKNGIFLVTNAAGVLSYEIFVNGQSKGGSVQITTDKPDDTYTMKVCVSGNSLTFSRVSGGAVQASKTVDVGTYFDLTDQSVMDSFQVVFGARAGLGNYVEYSKASAKESAFGQVKLNVWQNGNHALERVLYNGEIRYPFKIRADFAAESIGSNERKGFVSVWIEEEGHGTLLQNNIELPGINFSDPEVVNEYPAYLYYELKKGSSAEVALSHYLTGGAAQADPKPLHDETGAILSEGDCIWLAMTVRGYDIHTSYQGVYKMNLKTGELELVSILAFDLNGRGAIGTFHAADIIYNSMDDEWIVMPTAHNENPHSIKMGVLPKDPRTVPYQFVSVRNVNYPNQYNEEDASLIYDRDAGKWRLVMCDRENDGYELPLLEADTWDGTYKQVARYAERPCTGIQIQSVCGKYYVFFGRNTDNCEVLEYPQMSNPTKLNIVSSPRSYNVWPVIIPFKDKELNITRYYMLSFDRETHGGQHSYGNIYLYEAEQFEGQKAAEPSTNTQMDAPTSNDIYTKEDLMKIKNKLNGKFSLKADIDMSGITNWTPIGTKEQPFTGTIDGNGHTIKGLKIQRPNTNYVGLFGVCGETAVIKKLNITEGAVNGRHYTGMVCGYSYGEISDCIVSGKVEAFSSGGILTGANNGVVKNCSASGSVKSTGSDSMGGLLGYNSGNIGTISLKDKGVVSECNSDAIVSGNMNVGGLIGYNDCGSVDKCSAKGNVSGVSNVGGLIGNNGRNYDNPSKAPVSNCTLDVNVSGEYNTGGLIGMNDGKLTENTFAGYVAGKKNTGGICGTNNTHGLVVSATASVKIEKNEPERVVAIGFNRGIKEEIKMTVTYQPKPQEPAKPQPSKPQQVLPKKGSTHKLNGYQYKITKVSAKGGCVTVTGSANKKRTSIVIPSKVKINGLSFTVTIVSKKAFAKYTKATKITIGDNVTTIDASAFDGCKKVKQITVKGNKLKKIGKHSFRGISKKITVKGKKAKLIKKVLGK